MKSTSNLTALLFETQKCFKRHIKCMSRGMKNVRTILECALFCSLPILLPFFFNFIDLGQFIKRDCWRDVARLVSQNRFCLAVQFEILYATSGCLDCSRKVPLLRGFFPLNMVLQLTLRRKLLCASSVKAFLCCRKTGLPLIPT